MIDYLLIQLNARRSTRTGDRGASVVEYALIVAGIALVCIPVTIAFFHVLHTVFEGSCKDVSGTNSCG